MPNSRLFIDHYRDIVARHGARPALVVDGMTACSHAELWEQAEIVASGLIGRGIRRDDVVGLCLEKSPSFIAAMLGVWRTGAAYLPLDPRLPQDRSRFMLEDAGAKLIVTESCFTPPLGTPVVDIAEALKKKTQVDLDQIERRADDLAYVIYTSGSTGAPKGVAVEQRGLVNLLRSQIRIFELTEESRCLFLLSTSFDASVSDIGVALLSAAALCWESRPLGAADLPGTLKQRRISYVDIPPSLLAAIDADAAPEGLRTIVIGGEACPPEVVRRWAHRHRLVNVYGPTEATVCTSMCVCDALAWREPRLGFPIPGVKYRVNDSADHEAAPGEQGELLIGGECLARGYINRPALNARKFIELDGQRWFRTGDRVRRAADGNHEFIGRMDRQLKLRGHRIEPAEIEAELLRIPGVRRAAVVACRQSPSAPRQTLTAFIEGAALEERQLRDALSARLPVWMTPQRYEFRPQLPTTSSGKIDFRRLVPTPIEKGEPPFGPEYESDAERRLAEIWRRVLKLERPISADDDLPALGADSLASLEAAALAHARGLPIAPAHFLSSRTVRELACCAPARESRFAGAGPKARAEPPLRATAEQLRADIESEARELRARFRQQADRSTTSAPQGAILLTGATGFLGGRVLQSLLRRRKPRILCIVRATDDAAASNRLDEALRRQDIALSQAERARVTPLAGDLAVERFGRTREQWNRLTCEVGVIVHCAAEVHSLKSYGQLRNANVKGVAEVLRLMSEGIPKQLHYASTLSVFVETDRVGGRCLEADDLTTTREVHGGYAQTKWAAETLIRSAGAPPAHTSIYRLGLLTGDTRTGAAPPRDLLSLTVRGLMRIGCMPDDAARLRVDITPVDFAAEAMVRLMDRLKDDRNRSLDHSLSPPTYHIGNPMSLPANDLFRLLAEEQPELARVDRESFIAAAAASTTSDEAAAMLSLRRWLVDEGPRQRSVDLMLATDFDFDTTNARRALGDALPNPLPTDALIRFYLRNILAELESDEQKAGQCLTQP